MFEFEFRLGRGPLAIANAASSLRRVKMSARIPGGGPAYDVAALEALEDSSLGLRNQALEGGYDANCL